MNEVIHVFSEQDSKGSLLAEIRRLQSSLAAMRQARDFHGANSADLMRERDRMQEQVRVLRVALASAKREMIASGNWGARDYGWPNAYKMVEEALAATEPKP